MQAVNHTKTRLSALWGESIAAVRAAVSEMATKPVVASKSCSSDLSREVALEDRLIGAILDGQQEDECNPVEVMLVGADLEVVDIV